MPNHEQIYAEQAQQYDRLIARQPPLTDAIANIRPFDGLDVVDLGAGTGRLTCVLAPRAKSIRALDRSPAMLDVLAGKLRQAGLTNWTTRVADHRTLPLADRSADLVVAGWSVCYLGSSNVPDWVDNVDRIVGEIRRILRPGGTVIVFETLGTGHERPCPPDFLMGYYDRLERVHGFAHDWLRLDNDFDSPDEAEAEIRFFFGDELARRVKENRWTKVPECAGAWWKHV